MEEEVTRIDIQGATKAHGHSLGQLQYRHQTMHTPKRKHSNPLKYDRNEFGSRSGGMRHLQLALYVILVVVGVLWGMRRTRSPSSPAGKTPEITWHESSVDAGGATERYRFPLPLGFDARSTMYNDRRMMQHFMLTTMRQMMVTRHQEDGRPSTRSGMEKEMLLYYFDVFDGGKPIQRLHRPDPEFFFKNFVQQGRPAVITGVVDQWKAYKQWTDEYLEGMIGQKEVEVEVSRDMTFSGDNKRMRVGKLSVEEFLRRYRDPNSKDRYYLAETSIQENFPELQKDFPEVPSVIKKDLYRFDVSQLWIGPGGQITPMHSDDQENLLCQLDGSRKVILYDPYQADLLYLNPENEVYTMFDPDHPNYERHPLAEFSRPIVSELKEGEMLFMPSYWYHLVKSQAGRSLAVNYWYAPFSEVQSLTRLSLLSPNWRDPNDPHSKLIMGRKRMELNDD